MERARHSTTTDGESEEGLVETGVESPVDAVSSELVEPGSTALALKDRISKTTSLEELRPLVELRSKLVDQESKEREQKFEHDVRLRELEHRQHLEQRQFEHRREL